MSDRSRRPSSSRQSARPSNRPDGAPSGGRTTGPGTPGKGASKSTPAQGAAGQRPTGSGTSGQDWRAARRAAERQRSPQAVGAPTILETARKPFLISFLVFVITAIGFVVVTQAASPAYACGAIDTVQSPAPGELGQVQSDQGNQHVQTGDKIRYAMCPPASGKHINKVGYGPLQPKVYGPDDQSIPNGWVHNLEHGGLVLLYSCDKGACDATSIAALQAFSGQFPTSPVCGLPPGVVGPLIARFEQMPTKYAALLWDRALYLDTLDTKAIDTFFLRYGERLSSDGKLIAPPEPQCTAPSTSPAASSSPAPSGSGG